MITHTPTSNPQQLWTQIESWTTNAAQMWVIKGPADSEALDVKSNNKKLGERHQVRLSYTPTDEKTNVVSTRRQRLSGASITNTGWCEAEIRRPIARTATTKLNKIWRDSATTQNTTMFLIVSYAWETWTVREADKRRLDAFEICAYRRMLLISLASHECHHIRRAKHSDESVHKGLPVFPLILWPMVEGKTNGRRNDGLTKQNSWLAPLYMEQFTCPSMETTHQTFPRGQLTQERIIVLLNGRTTMSSLK